MLDIQRYIINAIRTKSPDLRYIRQLMVKEDKSLKVLSPYTTRRKELLEIQDPTVRNPKWSGRKRHAVNIAKPSKAIRVPGQIADVLKAIGDATKDYPYDIAVVQNYYYIMAICMGQLICCTHFIFFLHMMANILIPYHISETEIQ